MKEMTKDEKNRGHTADIDHLCHGERRKNDVLRVLLGISGHRWNSYL